MMLSARERQRENNRRYMEQARAYGDYGTADEAQVSPCPRCGCADSGALLGWGLDLAGMFAGQPVLSLPCTCRVCGHVERHQVYADIERVIELFGRRSKSENA